MRKARFAALPLLAAACGVLGRSAGMDPQRLARIPARMTEFVEQGTIAGAVTLLARRGMIVSLDAVGFQDIGMKIPMDPRSIFQIRSMTKPVTATAVMILLEEGRLLLSDAVEKYVPEFREQMVVDGRDGEKVVSTRKPSRPVTIYHLLTHTSGIADTPVDEPTETLAQHAALLPKVPLNFDPGQGFLYSDGGFAVLGRIIEVASGQPYEDFVEQRILRPLAMGDTFFFPPTEKCSRIASHYEPYNGRLRRYEGSLNPEWHRPEGCRAYARSVHYPGPSWGLFSTAPDIAAFHEMMLYGGTYKGVRILSRASVQAMTTIQTGDLDVGGPWWGYGLGWFVLRDQRPRDRLSLSSPGSFNHSGLRGTFGWVDPRNKLIGILMIQLEDEPGQKQALVRDTFIAMAYAAITEH